ncbi:hypothetical protein Taro_049803 [Colocasia esculenta]|uniref:Uncharacterized protein n=1 Tax=Colocasia esculenta TaxID=4460 RepID=A0A843XC12_COLES|nr:hypothetical protein [Colocasia esculenta]
MWITGRNTAGALGTHGSAEFMNKGTIRSGTNTTPSILSATQPARRPLRAMRTLPKTGY